MAQGDLIMSDTLRCCDPERDIAAIVEIENTAWVHAGFQFQATDEALLRNRWERMPTFVPERDCVVIERDGVVCAYGMVLPGETSAGERVFTLQGGVHPRAQRSGCGAVVLRWQEQRAREIAAGPCIVEMTMIDGQAGQRAFAAAAGFTPAWRYAQMLCELSVPLDVPQLPSGLRVRTPEVSERRRVLEARNAAFRSARGHVEATEDDYRGMEADPAAEPEGWLVAWDAHSGEPVGGAHPGVYEPDNARFGLRRGWVYWLWVKSEWRRRGVARALLARACAALRARGMNEATLFVDVDNESGVMKLYERAGFRLLGGWSVYRKVTKAERR